jgi:sucrose phosphorylase
MAVPGSIRKRMLSRLRTLYGDGADAVCRRLCARLERFPARGPALEDPGSRRLPFDERDAVLIAYGDSLRSPDEVPLAALRRFARARLGGLVSTIHLLPFFPYSSDDGFSVIDFHAVDLVLGGWADVAALGEDHRLVFDLVLNHISSRSAWFERYLAGEAPFEELAIVVAPGADLSAVTRPRALPLLSGYRRRDGSGVHLWTTFSSDQIDLNYASPEVLLAVVDVVLDYVERGAAMLRLDAVAYLWKRIGTPCIHLPETHEVVRLLRDVLDAVAPDVALLTETNVPHRENVSYFGDGRDEAQLVYNFTLPPLVLHALLTGSAEHLTRWARTLEAPSEATTFFNFTASHDGVGVRPLEGILSADEIERLAELTRRRGGRVSCRSTPEGGESPYELNVTYVDALRGTDDPAGDALHAARFIASQAVALCLPGVPALYIGSLLGSRNWDEGVRRLGHPRAVNREKLELSRVEAELDDPGSLRHRIFGGLSRLLRARAANAAFHPNAAMEVLALDPRCLAVRRGCRAGDTVLALTNVSAERLELSVPTGRDVLGGPDATTGKLVLPPYGVAWLAM